jgi:hypothetical protein
MVIGPDRRAGKLPIDRRKSAWQVRFVARAFAARFADLIRLPKRAFVRVAVGGHDCVSPRLLPVVSHGRAFLVIVG